MVRVASWMILLILFANDICFAKTESGTFVPVYQNPRSQNSSSSAANHEVSLAEKHIPVYLQAEFKEAINLVNKFKSLDQLLHAMTLFSLEPRLYNQVKSKLTELKVDLSVPLPRVVLEKNKLILDSMSSYITISNTIPPVFSIESINIKLDSQKEISTQVLELLNTLSKNKRTTSQVLPIWLNSHLLYSLWVNLIHSNSAEAAIQLAIPILISLILGLITVVALFPIKNFFSNNISIDDVFFNAKAPYSIACKKTEYGAGTLTLSSGNSAIVEVYKNKEDGIYTAQIQLGLSTKNIFRPKVDDSPDGSSPSTFSLNLIKDDKNPLVITPLESNDDSASRFINKLTPSAKEDLNKVMLKLVSICNKSFTSGDPTDVNSYNESFRLYHEANTAKTSGKLNPTKILEVNPSSSKK